jgi:hypothetical protein
MSSASQRTSVLHLAAPGLAGELQGALKLSLGTASSISRWKPYTVAMDRRSPRQWRAAGGFAEARLASTPRTIGVISSATNS